MGYLHCLDKCLNLVPDDSFDSAIDNFYHYSDFDCNLVHIINQEREIFFKMPETPPSILILFKYMQNDALSIYAIPYIDGSHSVDHINRTLSIYFATFFYKG